MAPQGQGIKWAEVLCCSVCSKIFSQHKHAVNLHCSHAVCIDCLQNKMDNDHFCLVDKIPGELPLSALPVNKAMMQIVGVDVERGIESCIDHDDTIGQADTFTLQNIDDNLCGIASYLRRVESERGGSVWSEVMSRTVQRKVVHLICLQLAEPSGRVRAARQARGVADRILCEMMMGLQNHQSVSHQLWTAVRARGCQFLGPGMQEDLLHLILRTMSDNALLSRKTIVQYVMRMLSHNYPHASKTCVGHVVQLLYRASCFNVLKQEGKSSLMMLKEEYTTYEALRREHDTQIVSIAIDAGLRISPDQWSSLLYGDCDHRKQMQSIIDKLQTTASFTNGIDDLRKLCKKEKERDELMEEMVQSMRTVDALTREIHEDSSLTAVDWAQLGEILEALRELVDKYADVLTRKNQARSEFMQQAMREGADHDMANAAAQALVRPMGLADAPMQSMFKTKWCRELPNCPRGPRCSYAHSEAEMRVPGGVSTGGWQGQPGPPPPAGRWPYVQQMQQQQQMQQMAPAPPPPQPPFVRPYAPPPQPQQMMPPAAAPPMMQPMMAASAAVPVPQPPQWQPQQQQQHIMRCPPHVSWLPTSELEQPQPYWGQQMMPVHKLSYGMMGGPQPQQLQQQSQSELSEMEQLHMRREEIISLLGPLSVEQDDALNGPSTSGVHGDQDDAHVAYTCASSVLDDRICDLMQANAASANTIIELPPMPPGFTPVITTTSEETLGAISELALEDAVGAASTASVKARTSSLTATTTVRTMCPAPYAPSFHTVMANGSSLCSTATVQADCSTMHVLDTISEPVPTPVIVPTSSMVVFTPSGAGAPGAILAMDGTMVAPNGAVIAPVPTPTTAFETSPESLSRDAARLPMVIQPLSQINPVQAEDPQDIVSSTLDRIVDVREKLTEVDGAASTVVKTQLEVELEIASRQIEQMDPLLSQNCLLKELEAVERRIEERRGEIESSASNSTGGYVAEPPVPPPPHFHYPQMPPMNAHGMQ